MKLDTKLAVENSAEKMKISPNTHAWVLPLKDGFHKMIAYIRAKKRFGFIPASSSGKRRSQKSRRVTPSKYYLNKLTDLRKNKIHLSSNRV